MEEDMNKELIEALDVLEKEKGIDREVIFDAIENSLLSAYKSHVEKVDNIKVNADNVKVNVDRKTGDFSIIVEKRVVEEVTDKTTEITLDEALLINKKLRVGDIANIEVKSKEFGRIVAQNAKNVILQKIREEEKNLIYSQYFEKQSDIVTGIVQRVNDKEFRG